MGILEDALVNQLLDTTPRFKRDIMEARIRFLLSAEPFANVTGLPARRGAADGGIDGVVRFSQLNNGLLTPETRAALNIKVRRTDFTREQLGGFILDMDREKINTGIILTAADLTPDAKAELTRKNLEGTIELWHIRLSDLLGGGRRFLNTYLNGRPLNELLAGNLRDLVEEMLLQHRI
ncbi:restriction endonuclease [Bordetella genomosp. 11]|uniref:Restriction endonuclease type IV Mrr domain-containing protein n=1 Tax=Bordetella genomosp. 11 TaxID=1416808 RepID=A0A261UET6_9BORD|nr:restriction endonuclease [Bordetella genomosp. 11]OZI60101.1 hypothetical protein CAL28_11580 [Bordetella genomosp. 11]